MKLKREIERSPAVPVLSNEAIQLLTQLCFRPDNPLEQVDLIFVFSSTTEMGKLADTIRSLLGQYISNKVFITGGIPDFKDINKIAKPESEMISDHIDKSKYPEVEFFTENKSTNTLANVVEALKVLDFSQYKKVLFVFKRHDSRRGYLTLRKFLPTAVLIQKTFSPTYPDTDRPLDKDTWHTYDFGKSRVWGEFLRIKKYGERGDIVYDDEIKSLIAQIEQLTKF